MISPSDPQIETLLNKMTLEEKVGQMTNLTLATLAADSTGKLILDASKVKNALQIHHVGAIQNVISHAYTLQEWHALINDLQKYTLDSTSQKIPFLYCIDAVHGANFILGSTIFPHNLNLAATRNPELVKKCAEITAMETRAAGIRYNFSPVLDVGRNPVWPRFAETFGEDVCLVKTLGTASVEGYQGEDVASSHSVACCLKHFIGYSAPSNGKDRAPAYIPEIVLREYYLPPFRKAIKAGAKTIMVNSGDVNGTPVHASKYLLRDVLRKELGFKGVVISDWQDILKLHERHHVAKDNKEAVLLAINAGIDMVIVPFDFSFTDDLIALVKEGKISEERIDASVRRILTLKKELNLFKEPYVEKEAISNFGKPEYKKVALQAAEESIVLLSNNSVLPLTGSKKILVTGPSANSLTALHGAWTYTWQGQKADFFDPETQTILTALKAAYGVENITYTQGLDFSGKLTVTADELKKLSARVDAIVVCAGENAYAETPGNIKDLALPEGQKEFIRMAAQTGKPVILVLTEGRPRLIREVADLAAAILFAGWPGSQGGPAIAAIISGKYNPSGKLPFTYPRWANELLTYDHKPLDEAVEVADPYSYTYQFNPQFKFGEGKSYTTYTYKTTLNKDTVKGDETIKVNIEVKNTGEKAGEAVVEVFLRDIYASVVPPVKRLKRFEKVALKAGESKSISFDLNKKDFAFVNAALKDVTEEGTFEVLVGGKKLPFYYIP